MSDLSNQLSRASHAVYLAVESEVADNISGLLRTAADNIQRLEAEKTKMLAALRILLLACNQYDERPDETLSVARYERAKEMVAKVIAKAEVKND